MKTNLVAGRGADNMKEKVVLPHHRIPEPRKLSKPVTHGSLVERAIQFAQWIIPNVQDEDDARLQHFAALYYAAFHILRDK